MTNRKNTIHAQLQCWGGVGKVTGANFILTEPSLTVMVDCGLIQGSYESMKENYKEFDYNPADIDVLFVTHAHIDHIGRIPKLVEEGFRGVIYSTPETKEIAEIMFDDAIKIMDYNLKEYGTKPLYKRDSPKKALALWKTQEYHTPFDVGPYSVSMKDAGHILGSAMIKLEPQGGGKSITFTGDLGNSPTPLLRDTEQLGKTEYLVMESVYGDRNHDSKKERDEKFKDVIANTIGRGGTVLIPAFSLERTQVILYEINNMVEDKKIKSVPVFLDSPLAMKVTDIYKRHKHHFNDAVKAEIKGGDDIFDFPRLTIIKDVRESESIKKTKGPKIIIAGSGMSAGGRIQSHEKQFLPGEKNTLILVGYQATGTMGRRLQEGAKKIKIDDDFVKVKAEVVNVLGYSSHKDSDGLVDFVGEGEGVLQKVFTVMGEPKSSLFLAQRIKDEYNIDAIYPERGKVYEIEL